MCVRGHIGAELVYTATGLLPFSTYFIRVRSRNDSGESDWSQPLRLQTTGSDATPEACAVSAFPRPGEGYLAPTNGALLVEWEPPPPQQGLEITKYEVEWVHATEAPRPPETDEEEEGGRSTAVAAQRGLQQVEPTSRAWTITALLPGAAYSVRVRAINRNGAGEWGGVLASAGLCLAPPPVVRLLDAGHARLTVAWERLSAADGAEEAMTFQVRCLEQTAEGGWVAVAGDAEARAKAKAQRSGRKNKEAEAGGQVVPGAGKHSRSLDSRALFPFGPEGMADLHVVEGHMYEWSVEDLEPETAHMIQVCALTARGSSGWSRPCCFSTLPSTRLEVIEARPTSATLAVHVAAQGEGDGGVELRLQNITATQDQSSTRTVRASENVATEVVDLQPGCAYEFCGRASGASAEWIGPVAFRTAASAPSAPVLDASQTVLEEEACVICWGPVADGGATIERIEVQHVQGGAVELEAWQEPRWGYNPYPTPVGLEAPPPQPEAEAEQEAAQLGEIYGTLTADPDPAPLGDALLLDKDVEVQTESGQTVGSRDAAQDEETVATQDIEHVLRAICGAVATLLESPDVEPEPEPEPASVHPTFKWRTVSNTANAFCIAGLSYETQISCRVRAVNAHGTSPWSAPLSITTLKSAQAQTSLPRLILSAKPPSIDSVAVQWKAASSGRQPTPSTLHLQHRLAVATPPALGVIWKTSNVDPKLSGQSSVPGLQPGCTYKLRLCAASDKGARVFSNVVTVSLPRSAPAEVQKLRATSKGSTHARLSWSAPSSSDAVEAYIITYQRLSAPIQIHVDNPIDQEDEESDEEALALSEEAQLMTAYSSLSAETVESADNDDDVVLGIVGAICDAVTNFFHTVSEHDTRPDDEINTEPQAEPEAEPEPEPEPEEVRLEIEAEQFCEGYVLKALAAGCLYRVGVASVNSVGEGPCAEVELRTSVGTPPALTLSLQRHRQRSLVVSWDGLTRSAAELAGASLQTVELRWTAQHGRHTVAQAAFSVPWRRLIALRHQPDEGSNTHVSSRRNRFKLRALVPGTLYHIQARAVCASGVAGEWSDTLEAATNAAPPAAPAVVGGDVSELAVSVVWQPSDDNGGTRVLYYDVHVVDVLTGVVVGGGHVDYSEVFTQYGLLPATDYSVRVRGVSAAGAGPWSMPALLRTNRSSKVPGAVTWQALGAADNSVQAHGPVDVAWQPPDIASNARPTGYELESLVQPVEDVFSSAFTILTTNKDSPSVERRCLPLCRSAALTALAPGEACRFRIRAINSQVRRANSMQKVQRSHYHVVSCTAALCTLYYPVLTPLRAREQGVGPWSTSRRIHATPQHPAAPVIDTVVAHADALDVSWALPASRGASLTSFDVALNDAPLHECYSPSTRVSGLAPSHSYSVRVRAWNAVGPSAWSDARVTITRPLPELERVEALLNTASSTDSNTVLELFHLLSTLSNETLETLRQLWEQNHGGEELSERLESKLRGTGSSGMLALLQEMLLQPMRSGVAAAADAASTIRAATRPRGQDSHCRPLAAVLVHADLQQLQTLCATYVELYGRTVHEELALLEDTEFVDALLELLPQPQTLVGTADLDALHALLAQPGPLTDADMMTVVDTLVAHSPVRCSLCASFNQRSCSDREVLCQQDTVREMVATFGVRFGRELPGWLQQKCTGGLWLAIHAILGGSGNTCYHCRRPGHWKEECPRIGEPPVPATQNFGCHGRHQGSGFDVDGKPSNVRLGRRTPASTVPYSGMVAEFLHRALWGLSLDHTTVIQTLIISTQAQCVHICDAYAAWRKVSLRAELEAACVEGERNCLFLYAVCQCLPADSALRSITGADTADALFATLSSISVRYLLACVTCELYSQIALLITLECDY
jgi:hypothetical protein